MKYKYLSDDTRSKITYKYSKQIMSKIYKNNNTIDQGGDARIVIIITNMRCLKCRYCPISKSHDFISWEGAQKAINFLFASRNKNLQINFYGGEPLMAPFILIRKRIIHAKLKAFKEDENIDFIIPTNGILLDDKKIYTGNEITENSEILFDMAEHMISLRHIDIRQINSKFLLDFIKHFNIEIKELLSLEAINIINNKLLFLTKSAGMIKSLLFFVGHDLLRAILSVYPSPRDSSFLL